MRAVIPAFLASIISSGILAAGDTHPTETYVSAHDLAAKVAHAAKGAPSEIPNSTGYQVLMIQRDATGDAEVHMGLNDTIIIQQGHGQFLVGGKITGNHEVSPGEWRGGEINGAHAYAVSVGDLLLIPAGIPHKAIVANGAFSYLAIKTPALQAKAP